MKLARDETKIRVTGRSFYRKNNLKFSVGTGAVTVDEKFGTRNRNLGKMARFRNTDVNDERIFLCDELFCPECWRPAALKGL
jgi:hypothetical protein